MSIPDLSAQQIGVTCGWQIQVTGSCQTVSGTPTIDDIDGRGGAAGSKHVKLATFGALGTGTYYFYIPITGAAAVDVTLRTSAATGSGLSTTATLYRLLNDNVTEKMNAVGASAAVAFAAFVNGTQQTVSITTLRGERGCLLKLVVPGASSVTLDQAESSAL